MKMSIISKAFLCAAVILIVSVLPSCKKGVRNLDRTMQQFEKEGQKRKHDLFSPFSGVVLVAKNDEVVFKKAYGFSDRSNMIGSDVDGIYPIASLTKQFTSLLTLMLEDGGHLHLDDNIGMHLPGLQGVLADSITIHQLLSHTSGLPHYEGLESVGVERETYLKEAITPEKYVEMIGKVSLVSRPGDKFAYSSLGYILLGAILESASGKTYAELLDSLITGQLGLANTGFAGNDFISDKSVPGYRFSRNGGLEIVFSKYHGKFLEPEFRDQSSLYSTGGMHSTLDDLFAWSQAVREMGTVYEAYLTPNLNGYCYGWVRNEVELVRRNIYADHYTHTGDLSGHSASITLYDDGTTIIHLANVQPLNDNELIHQLYLAAHSLEDVQQPGKLPNTRSIAGFEEGGGMRAFNDYYSALSGACGYAISPSPRELSELMFLHHENEKVEVGDSLKSILLADKRAAEGLFNTVGYRFLGRRKCDNALDFFKANCERHPESDNVWDSQGDGFMDCKEYAKAIESFAEAVRLAELNEDGNLELYQRNLEDAKEALAGDGN